MDEKTVNWLVFTCLLGLIPVLARLFLWSISTSGVEPVAVGDLVAFGLVLHSANINEVNRIAGADQRWKIVHNGTSVLFLVGYALSLCVTIIETENFSETGILHATIAMAIATFFLNFSVMLRAQSERRRGR